MNSIELRSAAFLFRKSFEYGNQFVILKIFDNANGKQKRNRRKWFLCLFCTGFNLWLYLVCLHLRSNFSVISSANTSLISFFKFGYVRDSSFLTMMLQYNITNVDSGNMNNKPLLDKDELNRLDLSMLADWWFFYAEGRDKQLINLMLYRFKPN